ncbi:hypothetical protein Tco_1444377 [Tanacetum coccineum]
MLALGHYAQWSSQFMRYVHMKSNKDQLRRVYQQARCEDQVVLGVWQITSRDGESIMSYYSRFYKVMNEMVRNKLKVNTILFDIMKQHQNEVNKIRAEKIARNANPLILVAAAQHYLDTYSLDTYY